MSYARYRSNPVQLVDALIKSALVAGASDIHLEPTGAELRVRFRIDGLLADQQPIEAAILSQVIARIEVVAHIDSAKKRIAQDGKFSLHFDEKVIDFRVSTFPGLYGLTMVIRILDRSRQRVALSELGFSAPLYEQFMELIHHSCGFMLVAGPTGSGKTTTLYGALSELNTPEKNIITLEDPVEYTLPCITQGHIHPAAGFTFQMGMRALLRQDPDIVMIGEIRDRETAHIALEASLTGHFVFSTVHTGSAVRVIMRLMDMGIEPFLINASLTGVLAQRLARTICQSCLVAYAPNEEERSVLQRLAISVDQLYKGMGCDACQQRGCKGRTGIFELLAISDALRLLIVQNPNFTQLYEAARSDGMKTLFEDGVLKLQAGQISLAELMRVLV